MSKQPEALQIADDLDRCWADPGLQLNAATELRRLHEVNTELLKALKNISLCSQNSMSSKTECGTIARAAIEKAEGESNEQSRDATIVRCFEKWAKCAARYG